MLQALITINFEEFSCKVLNDIHIIFSLQFILMKDTLGILGIKPHADFVTISGCV